MLIICGSAGFRSDIDLDEAARSCGKPIARLTLADVLRYAGMRSESLQRAEGSMEIVVIGADGARERIPRSRTAVEYADANINLLPLNSGYSIGRSISSAISAPALSAALPITGQISEEPFGIRGESTVPPVSPAARVIKSMGAGILFGGILGLLRLLVQYALPIYSRSRIGMVYWDDVIRFPQIWLFLALGPLIIIAIVIGATAIIWSARR